MKRNKSRHLLPVHTALTFLFWIVWHSQWCYTITSAVSQRFRIVRSQGSIIRKEHSRLQRPRSFWSAPRITTSGPVQHRKSAIHGLSVKSDKSDKSDWLRVRNESSAHAQIIGSGQRSRSLTGPLTSGADKKERGLWGREWWASISLVTKMSKFKPFKSFEFFYGLLFSRFLFFVKFSWASSCLNLSLLA